MAPYPILNIFGLKVYPYGVLIAVGILVCLLVFYIYTKKLGMAESVQDFCFYVAIGAIALGFVAAAFFQGVYEWISTGRFSMNTGITAMGGFIGGGAAFILLYFGVGKLIFKKKKLGLHLRDFNKIVVTAPCCITVAHAFGRIGCVMAGCCYGRFVSDSYVFGTIPRYSYSDITQKTTLLGYYVPVELYEALFLFALFGVLSVLLLKKRSNLTMPIYLIAYGVWRFVIEFFRGDVAERGGNTVLGLFPSQWMSVLFVLGGIAIILIYHFKKIPFTLSKTEQSPASATEETDTTPPENKA